ncbi:unnamed protein product [Ectocarpus sp. CCAP 1310/34]|nr:unnamed protein product [Ectocarpus sp. CCAP 1310/34]
MVSGGKFARLAGRLLGLGTTTLVVAVGASSPSWNQRASSTTATAFLQSSLTIAVRPRRSLPSTAASESWVRPVVGGLARRPVGSSVDTNNRIKPLAMAVSVLLHDEPISFGGRRPFTSHAARWFIKRRILSTAKASAALNVEVEARNNRDAMRGRWESISIDFAKTIFEDIQVSGGAFELLGVDVLTLGLLPGPWRRLRRLRRPCEAIGRSTFTDVDVAYSPAIRRLAQRVVNHALQPRAKRAGVVAGAAAGGGGAAAAGSLPAATTGGAVSDGGEPAAGSAQQQGRLEPSVSVLGVRVHGNKLAIEGEMTNGGTFLRVPFRYHFSLSASQDGHVLYFKGSSVYWGTPGGHVPLPMMPLQSFKIDLGDRARIEHLRISRGVLSVGGRFILTNTPGFTVALPGLKRGDINYDLAEGLSRLVSNCLNLRRE